MRESYWGYWLVILGVFVIGVMLLVNNISTNNTQDYYNIKEVTQASMVDAIDFSYYRLYGNLKISEQKFVENFVRRFAENVNMANEYDVEFFDLYEVPPKVSVKISSGTRSFQIGASNNEYDTTTTFSSILELGARGEATPNGKTTTKKGCALNLTSTLMDYFKGKTIGKYNINTDGLINLTAEQKEKLATIETLEEFKTWFNYSLQVPGTTQNCKDYLSNTSWDTMKNDPNNIFIIFKGRGWIK